MIFQGASKVPWFSPGHSAAHSRCPLSFRAYEISGCWSLTFWRVFLCGRGQGCSHPREHVRGELKSGPSWFASGRRGRTTQKRLIVTVTLGAPQGVLKTFFCVRLVTPFFPHDGNQERHGCAQKRRLMKSLKSEARAVPWRRRGGCSPAPAATPPRFRLLFRHPVGSSPIGQFKPPREPLGFSHLGPAPGVTEMPCQPQPQQKPRPLPGAAPRRHGDARRHRRARPRLV